jgi:hypothetical protein
MSNFEELLLVLGNLGEFIGGLFVVVTLGYLAVQTRQQSKVGYWQMYSNGSGQLVQLFTEIAKDAALSQLWLGFLAGRSDDLSDEQSAQCFSLFLATMHASENAFLMNKEFGQASVQDRMADTLRWVGRNPAATAFWRQTKAMRTLEFQNFVDELVLRDKARD